MMPGRKRIFDRRMPARGQSPQRWGATGATLLLLRNALDGVSDVVLTRDTYCTMGQQACT